MLDPQDEMLAVFLDESAENLAVLEQGLLRLDRDPSDRAPLDSAFRAAHSIKGGSSFFGIEAVTRLAHALENVLDRIRSGQMASTRPVVDLLLRSADALGRFLNETRGGACPLTGHEGLVGELHKVVEAPPSVSAGLQSAVAPTVSAPGGSTTAAAALGEYIALLEGLANWGASVFNSGTERHEAPNPK